MKRSLKRTNAMGAALLVLFLICTAFGSSAEADDIHIIARFNVDNYFALYAGNQNNLSFIGARDVNSLNTDAIAFPYIFDVSSGDYIYMTGWSDKACAQAFLGEFDYGTGKILTGTTSGWEVYLTNHDLNWNDPAPSVSQIKSDIISAVWKPVTLSLPYESGPWWDAWRTGISPEADWIWGSNLVGQAVGEYQLFRVAVPSDETAATPEPATMMLLGSGLFGFAVLGRKFGNIKI